MDKIIERIQSYLVMPSRAQERISDLLTELRHRGVNFDIQLINEDGYRYFYAKSVDYPRGCISATGQNMDELERELKDAMFTAFEIPVRYCNSDLIVFDPPLAQDQISTAHKKIYATT